MRYFLETPAGRASARADVAASFQAAVVDVLLDRLDRAARLEPYRAVVLSGGVAANSVLQAAFLDWGRRHRIHALVPQFRFCTDNAAMIAAAADRQGATVRSDPKTLAADPSLPFALEPVA